VIPETGAKLLAFVLLVIPGIVFELLRRTRRPSVDRSVFGEISVAVLSSAVFTLRLSRFLPRSAHGFGPERCQTSGGGWRTPMTICASTID
jgi:Family of unknown function (DUF6338)